MSTTLPITVADRLLDEVSRFFTGGIQAVLAELFQNAHRTGAVTRVDITYDPDARRLTFSDDGPGVGDPTTMFSAGASGWGDDIIDPAGLGIFSLANPSLFNWARIESRSPSEAWAVILDQAALTNREMSVEPLEANSSTGVRVEMALSKKAEIAEAMVEQERGFYPFRVGFHTVGPDSASREIEPPVMPQDGFWIDLPAGRVAYSSRNSRSYRFTAQPIWDCRIVRSSSLGDRFLYAALALEEPRRSIGRALFGDAMLHWWVNPASGVRPRLPDRADLLDSPPLTEAVQQIVEALIDRFSEAVKALVQDLPDEFASLSSIPGLDEGPHGGLLRSHLRVIEDCLPYFGIDKVRYENPLSASVGVSINGDETEVDFYCDAASAFLRHPVRVRDRATALALCIQGKWAVEDEHSDLTARIHGLRLNLTRRPLTHWEQEQELPAALEFPLVAFAERIEVPGVCDLPFLLREDPDASWPLDDYPGLEPTDSFVMVFAGSPLDFLRTFSENNFAAGILHYLHEAGELWEWAEFNDSYDGLDEEAFLDRVSGIVLKGYMPEHAIQLEQALACRDAAAALQKTCDELTRRRIDLTAGQGALDDKDLSRYDVLQVEIETMRDLLQERGCELNILAHPPRRPSINASGAGMASALFPANPVLRDKEDRPVPNVGERNGFGTAGFAVDTALLVEQVSWVEKCAEENRQPAKGLREHLSTLLASSDPAAVIAAASRADVEAWAAWLGEQARNSPQAEGLWNMLEAELERRAAGI